MPRPDTAASATLRRLSDLTAPSRAAEPPRAGWTPPPAGAPLPHPPAPMPVPLPVPSPVDAPWRPTDEEPLRRSPEESPRIAVPPDDAGSDRTPDVPRWADATPVDPRSGQGPDVPPWVAARSVDAQPGPGPATAALGVRTERALEAARAGYARAHGHPLDREPRVVRRRVRWAVPWRLAGAAGAVLLLVAGAVALRATAAAPGEPVALPTPAPDGPVAGGLAADGLVVGAGTSSIATVPEGRSGAGESATGVAPQVVVHVVGAVGSPGIVRLPAGSRVVDALASAGGASADADLAALNLARVLVDGEQVVVPRPGEASTSAGPASSAGGSGLVDLNTADVAALDDLPGIGPVLAQRIVEHRDERRFASVDELGDVAGIGPTLLERLRPLVRV